MKNVDRKSKAAVSPLKHRKRDSVNIRERDVESSLVKGLGNSRVLCLKFLPFQCAGMPDRLLVCPDGKVLWVELKTENGRLSPLQIYRHTVLERLGHRIEVVWTKEQALKLAGALTERYRKTE